MSHTGLGVPGVCPGSGFHGADGNHNDQDNRTGGRRDQGGDLANLCSPELGFFPFQQGIVAWSINVFHPVL